jgi:hypothetical protein
LDSKGQRAWSSDGRGQDRKDAQALLPRRENKFDFSLPFYSGRELPANRMRSALRVYKFTNQSSLETQKAKRRVTIQPLNFTSWYIYKRIPMFIVTFYISLQPKSGSHPGVHPQMMD